MKRDDHQGVSAHESGGFTRSGDFLDKGSAAETSAESSGSTLLGLLKLVRPHQWVKNLFVLAPLVFSKRLMEIPLVLQAVGAFFLFSLTSGVVYVFNDLKDIEADRRHPVKKRRPLASGQVSVQVGKTLVGVLGVVALGGGFAVGISFGAFLFGYLVLNLFYTLYFKRVPYVDVACIATGFLLRVLAGAAVVGVDPSVWLIVCTGLLAAFLGLGKRAFELRVLGKEAPSHRAVLAKYRLYHLNIALVIAGVATLVAYLLYTRSPHTVAFFGTHHLMWTAPFPAIGLFRFGMILRRGDTHESPTEEMLKDPVFLINMAVWATSVLAIIYVL